MSRVINPINPMCEFIKGTQLSCELKRWLQLSTRTLSVWGSMIEFDCHQKHHAIVCHVLNVTGVTIKRQNFKVQHASGLQYYQLGEPG